MEYDHHFIIAGNPKAQGRHRARYIKPKLGFKGKVVRAGFILFYDDPDSKKEKERISAFIKKAVDFKPYECALQVDLVFCMKRPLAHYGTGKNRLTLKPSAPTRHIKKPDIDNLRKLIMDALTGVLWKDDCIICQGEPIKRYSERPRTEIFIKILKEEQENLLWQKKENKELCST